MTVRLAWADYIGGFRWTHVVHLTTRRAISVAGMERAFACRFHRAVARIAQKPVPFFYVVEFTAPGHPHVHALIDCGESVRVKQLAGVWRLGYSRITIYDPKRSAAPYATKHLGLQTDAYQLSRTLPARENRVRHP